MKIVDNYLNLCDKLMENRGIFEAAHDRRFAALAALPVDSTAARTGRALLDIAMRLKDSASFADPLNNSLRFAFAAILHRHNIDTHTFRESYERAKGSFKGQSLIRSAAWDQQTVLWLLATGRRPDPSTLNQLFELFKAAKSHHWWLTNQSDLPALVFLLDRPGTPRAILERVEGHYASLIEAGLPKGDPLQTAAFFFEIADAGLDDAARAGEIWSAFKKNRLWMFGSDADEVGLLTLGGGRAAEAVEDVLAIRRRLRQKPHDHGIQESFRFACSLAALERAGPNIARLSAAKALFDLQGLIAARQSAAAGATT